MIMWNTICIGFMIMQFCYIFTSEDTINQYGREVSPKVYVSWFFFLVLLTSLFFKTFKHVWHIIVLISMLWFILYVELNSIYWNTNLSLFFPAWILTSFFHILYYVTYIDYANHKSLSMKTNTIYVKMFRSKRHYTSKHFALRCFCGDQKKKFGGGGWMG